MPEPDGEKPDFDSIFGDALQRGGMPEMPEVGSYQEAAVAQNEIYGCLRAAGFSTAAALYMTAVAVSGQPGPPPKDEPELPEVE